MNIDKKNTFVSYLSLFTSVGTIFCCALPSLLVVLGMGTALAGLIGRFPQLVWISEYKNYVFLISGCLILASGLLMYSGRNAPCPIDPDQARACASSRRWSLIVLAASAILWSVGFIFAFIAPWFV